MTICSFRPFSGSCGKKYEKCVNTATKFVRVVSSNKYFARCKDCGNAGLAMEYTEIVDEETYIVAQIGGSGRRSAGNGVIVKYDFFSI